MPEFHCRLIDNGQVVGEQTIEAKNHAQAYQAGNDGMGPFECIARGEPVRWVEVSRCQEDDRCAQPA